MSWVCRTRTYTILTNILWTGNNTLVMHSPWMWEGPKTLVSVGLFSLLPLIYAKNEGVFKCCVIYCGRQDVHVAYTSRCLTKPHLWLVWKKKKKKMLIFGQKYSRKQSELPWNVLIPATGYSQAPDFHPLWFLFPFSHTTTSH